MFDHFIFEGVLGVEVFLTKVLDYDALTCPTTNGMLKTCTSALNLDVRLNRATLKL